jgi:hypothetical protein
MSRSACAPSTNPCLNSHRRPLRLAGFALLASALAGCAHVEFARVHELLCRPGEQAMQRHALYFGRSRPDGGSVGDADWQAFEREVVTPAFPAGYSLFDGRGAWRGDDGATIEEASRVLVVLHPFDAASENAVAHIADEYRRRYAQESVLSERSVACVRF